MMGVILDVLREAVEDQFGEELWFAAIERAGASGSYTSLQQYPDAEVVGIVTALAGLLDISVDDAWAAGGQLALPVLASRHPEMLQGHRSWVDVVAGLDDIVHPHVKRVFPDADVPGFAVIARTEQSILVDYSSRRQLCRLAHGLLLGLGDHFGVEVAVEHRRCVHTGDDKCVIAATQRGG